MPVGLGLAIIDRLTLVTTATGISTSTYGTIYCYAANQIVQAYIPSASGYVVTSGTIEFRLYSNNTSYVSLANGTLTTPILWSSVIPAGTTTPGQTYYLQAIYVANSSYKGSQSPSGVSGTPFYPIQYDTTTTTISGSSFICSSSSASTFSSLTLGTNLGPPSFGSIAWSYNNLSIDATYPLGSVSVSNGISSITIPGGTFIPGYLYTINAIYSDSSNSCYSGSFAASYYVSIVSTATTTTISGPTSSIGCAVLTFISNTVRTTDSSSPNVGTVQFTVTSGATTTPLGIPISVVNGLASISTASGTFASGSYTIKAVYTGSGCYANSTSSGHSLSILSNTTTTSVSIVGGMTTFTECTVVSFVSATERSSDLSTPTVGSIQFNANSTPTGQFVLGIVDTLSSGGIASITCPSETFAPGTTFTITAVYTGSGCYSGSTSSGLLVNTISNATGITIGILGMLTESTYYITSINIGGTTFDSLISRTADGSIPVGGTVQYSYTVVSGPGSPGNLGGPQSISAGGVTQINAPSGYFTSYTTYTVTATFSAFGCYNTSNASLTLIVAPPVDSS